MREQPGRGSAGLARSIRTSRTVYPSMREEQLPDEGAGFARSMRSHINAIEDRVSQGEHLFEHEPRPLVRERTER